MLIYMIRNRINGKFYIGKTTYDSPAERWQCHIRQGIRGQRRTHLYNAIRKHGVENFELVILCPNAATVGHLNMLEEYWIERLGANNSRHGYNLTKGGEGGNGGPGSGMFGKHHSRETCRRISEAKTGHRHSLETRRKIRKGMTEEVRRKISRAMKSRHVSKETRRRMSRAREAYWRRGKVAEGQRC